MSLGRNELMKEIMWYYDTNVKFPNPHVLKRQSEATTIIKGH